MAQRKKVDRRIVRTRRALRDSLMDLVLEVGYAQISIRDLADRADIGYATFYRHFKSKDELLSHVLKELLAEFEMRLDPGMTTFEVAVAMYETAYQNQKVCLAASELPRGHPAVKEVWEGMFRLAKARYRVREGSEIPLDLSINHVVKSLWESIRWWLRDGARYSPRQMAQFHLKLIVDIAEEVAIDPRLQPPDESANDQHDGRIDSPGPPPNTPD